MYVYFVDHCRNRGIEMFYIITILGATVLVALGNFMANRIYTLADFWEMLLVTSLGVVAVIAIDGVLAFIVRRMPEKWFAPEAKLFAVGKRERGFYRRSNINSWKKYVPELGCFTGFHKDRMRDPTSSAYIARFLLESNYGVLGHVAGAVFGFLIMLLPFLRPLSMGLPIAVVNFILSMLPTMILRFNTPALRRIYRGNLAREQRASEVEKELECQPS